jgi:hypothetical protein
MLAPHQAEQFWSVLHEARDKTAISGILYTINRCLDLTNGGLILELQAARLDGATTRKIQELISDSRKEPK